MKDDKTTRDILILSAAKLVATKGFDRTSVQDVMDEAGVGKGSFYHHFSCKDELGLAVLEQDRASFIEMLDACLEPGEGVNALRRFFETALQKHSVTGFIGGCLWGNTALEMSDCNSAFVEPVDTVFREWSDRISRVIETAQKNKEIRDDANVSDLALFVVAAIEGGIMLSRLRKNETPMRTCLALLLRLLSSDGANESKLENNNNQGIDR
jgi:TetR/AcrR family transcriptional repressor of nem operon